MESGRWLNYGGGQNANNNEGILPNSSNGNGATEKERKKKK